ncbi:MAG: glycosyltransferase family 4 protein [Desulfuromonadaceae bacterium]|nr:glycosyltransferase family 4 protein [Desulfuromonadaceae bacterium]
MRVLLISGDFPPARSGEAAHAFHLALNLARRGVEVHVLTSAVAEVNTHPDFTVHPLMRSWSWWEVPRFIAFLRRCRPDAILLLYLGAMYDFHPMITFSPTISKGVLHSPPFVVQFENPASPAWEKTFFGKLFRKLAVQVLARKGADYTFGTLLHDSRKIIFLCGAHRKLLEELYPQIDEKGFLAPPPPFMEISEANSKSRAQGRALIGADPSDFLLVYFGYIYTGKGLETLLKALKIVSVHEIKIRLVIVGGFVDHFFAKDFGAETKKYSDTIFALQDSLGVADKVTWIGHAQQEQVTCYLRAADLCVLPFDKGIRLNNSSFAAVAAHGLPVITTNSGESDPQFSHCQNVFLCPPKEPEALAAGILALLENPDLRSRLSSGVLNLAEEWFSWNGTIQKTMEALSLKTSNDQER